MSNNRSGTFIAGVVLGATLGTLTGLLLAPRSGRETRKLLKKSADALPELAEDLSSSVQLQADRISETALRRWEGTLERLREAIAAGVEASMREREILDGPETTVTSRRRTIPKTSPNLATPAAADSTPRQSEN